VTDALIRACRHQLGVEYEGEPEPAFDSTALEAAEYRLRLQIGGVRTQPQTPPFSRGRATPGAALRDHSDDPRSGACDAWPRMTSSPWLLALGALMLLLVANLLRRLWPAPTKAPRPRVLRSPHHLHYCTRCDRQWDHAGPSALCTKFWAALCPGCTAS